MRRHRTIYFNDARHYYLFVYDPPMRMEDARVPVDEVAGTSVDTFSYGVSRADGLFYPSKVENERVGRMRLKINVADLVPPDRFEISLNGVSLASEPCRRSPRWHDAFSGSAPPGSRVVDIRANARAIMECADFKQRLDRSIGG